MVQDGGLATGDQNSGLVSDRVEVSAKGVGWDMVMRQEGAVGVIVYE